VEFRLLGPVEAVWEGRRLSLGGSKPTAVLVVLLLNRGRVVAVDRIVDLVWGEGAPGTARGLVASHVAALRRGLSPAGRGVIVTRSPGYFIDIDASKLDSAVFEQAVTQHRRVAAEGKHRQAAEGLTVALSAWRGERALEGMTQPFAEAEAVRLGELRMLALETRFACLLALGAETEILPELFAQVGANPVRETLRAQLMVALYRVGRQADALRIYQEGHELIVAELGVDPGPQLRAVRQAVLTDDLATLLADQTSERADGQTGGQTSEQARAKPAPNQLPADIADFTGRRDAARWVRELAAGSGGTAVAVGVISGRAGTGKTALAVRMGHELASRFPHGQLFLNLQSDSRRIEPAEAIERLLRALGVEAAMMPTGLDERVEMYRMLLAGRRVLVVLDNAADEGQIRPLLPGAPTCVVVVTSRSRLAGLEGAAVLDLEVMDERDAVTLLARIAGGDRVTANAGAANAAAEVVRLCGRLPLAVRIAGARLAARPHWTVARLAERLRDEQNRLDELVAGDLAVRASFGLSYLGLPEEGRQAARRLGLIRVPDFAAWMVAPLLDTDTAAAEDLVDRLVQARLVDPIGMDPAGQARYRMHDLIRLYVRERALAEETADDRQGALYRVISCWLGILDEAAARGPAKVTGRLIRGTERWALDQPTVERLLAEPVGWFAAEMASLVAIVEQCADGDLDQAACELASVLIASPFALYNEFDAWSRTHEVALLAVRRAGNRNGEAVLLAGLGQLRYEQDRFAESHEYFRDALLLFRETGDLLGEATALAGIGSACWEQADFAEASYFLDRARAAFTELGDEAALAHVRYGLGVVAREQGRYDEATDHLTAALSVYRADKNLREEAIVQRSLGLVHRARGEYRRAAELFALTIGMFDGVGDLLGAAYAKQALAKALLRLGQTGQAAAALAEAREICHDRRDRFGEALVTRTRGELFLEAGDLAAAEEALRAALLQWDVLRMPLWRARTLRDLGRVHAARGETGAAERAWEEAFTTFRRVASHEAGEPPGSPERGPGRTKPGPAQGWTTR